ncbi:HD domain-containing protein [Microbacterium sp. YY-03]|uniref:HD domain-containing protein n=1 Tax=Microbacterium sp. YY-03 TaxID=3421636 RepID=UPI003D1680B4
MEPFAAMGAQLRDIALTSKTPATALRASGLIERIPEFTMLATIPQEPRWHPEGDVLTHALLAIDEAARVWDAQNGNADRRDVVVLAAFLHDVGKPATTKAVGGKIVSPGHAEAGAKLVLELGERLGWPLPFSQAISAIVGNHMVPVSVPGVPSQRAVRRLITRLTEAGTTIDEWAAVVAADSAAREEASIPSRAVEWIRVAREL